MHRRIIILILVLALILMIAYKQDWFPSTADEEQSNQTALAVNADMQEAFDAGQGVWLIFSSDT